MAMMMIDGSGTGGAEPRRRFSDDDKARIVSQAMMPGASVSDVARRYRVCSSLGHVDRVEALLADKGYDADSIRKELAKADVEAMIPSKVNRRLPIPHDREKYRWSDLVERLFSKLKNWRRVATRYGKTAESYLGFVAIASVTLWLLFVHEA